MAAAWEARSTADASIRGRFPFVIRAYVAFPPKFLARPRGDVRWCDLSISSQMPLCRHLGREVGEAVGHGHFKPTAERAACAFCRPCLPLVIRACGALPPELLVRSRGNTCWCNIAIFGRMSLGRHRRRDLYKTVGL
jgi:hypothetical protein